MIFTPPKATGLTSGLGGFVLVLGLDGFLVFLIRRGPPSLLAFLGLCLLLASLPALGWLAFQLVGLIRARYVVSRNALVVDWGTRREVIPLPAISALHSGAEVRGDLRPRGVTLPGLAVGTGEAHELGEVEFLSTTVASPADLILLQHPGGWLALSPADPHAFREAFEAARAAGPTDAIEPESLTLAVLAWELWREPLALALIAGGALAALALTGYLSSIFPLLPPEIALHFGPGGQPDRFGPPAGLFILPAIGALAWLVNTAGGAWLHRRPADRAGAYLLFGATVFVQALTWAAAIGLLTAG
jgi:hypothetical protein